jgi:hypothetical protein
MYLKPTIQKTTNIGYLPNLAENIRLSDLTGILTPQKKNLTIFYLYFLSRNFILSGCGMVGKICGGKKKYNKSIVGQPGTQ